MLPFSLEVTSTKIGDVSKDLRQAASKRKGEWKVTAWEEPRISRFGCNAPVAHSVIFTEKEFERLFHVVTHGLRTKCKEAAVYGNVEMVCRDLWPTGNLDHVAMRHVGAALLVHYITQRTHPFFSTRRDWMPTISLMGAASVVARRYSKRASHVIWSIMVMYFCYIKMRPGVRRPTLQRVGLGSGHGEGTLPSGDGALPAADGGTLPPPTTSPPISPPSKDGDKPPREPPHGPADQPGHGATPSDAEMLSKVQDNMVDTCAGKDTTLAVIGKTFDGDRPNEAPIVGAIVGPISKPPNIYAKNASNVKAAIRERLEKKSRPFTLDKAGKARVTKMVDHLIGYGCKDAPFSEERIARFAESRLRFEDLASKKWSGQRLEHAVKELAECPEPEFRCKADIKLEPMPDGKAPRMLIADGDPGQVMALTSVVACEELQYDWFENRSIKHAKKTDALDRCVAELRKVHEKTKRADADTTACNLSDCVEGDGSAWDTTCGPEIRKLVENRILEHITRCLIKYGLAPPQWLEAHNDINSKEKLKLLFRNTRETMKTTIRAIRRSGHRGTSCLNWLENYVLWVCSIFKEPWVFIKPGARKAMCLDGVKRRWNGMFEGDDSLCVLFPRMSEEMQKLFLDFWSNCGFNMKIVFAKKVATFVGWHIAVDDKGLPTHTFLPEVPRAMAGAGISTSPSSIAAVKLGDVKTLHKLGGAAMLARGFEFAGRAPTISNKYLDYAERLLGGEDVVDREMSMRTYGEEGHSSFELMAEARRRNNEVTMTDELELFARLGQDVTLAELERFRDYPWDWSVLKDHAAFRAALPGAWRQ